MTRRYVWQFLGLIVVFCNDVAAFKITPAVSPDPFVVPHASMKVFTLTLGHDEMTLQGSFAISGGKNSDIRMQVVQLPENNILTDTGKVSRVGRVRLPHLGPGRYQIVFDNRFSLLSDKLVTPDLQLSY